MSSQQLSRLISVCLSDVSWGTVPDIPHAWSFTLSYITYIFMSYGWKITGVAYEVIEGLFHTVGVPTIGPYRHLTEDPFTAHGPHADS